MTMIKRILTVVTVASICLIGQSADLKAQSNSQSSRSLGMGGTGTAFITGYQANNVNPANLLLHDGSPRFSLGLLGGLQISGGGSLIDFNIYEEYFTKGKTLTGSVANDLFNDWYGTSSNSSQFVGVGVDLTSFGTSMRFDKWAYGASVRTRINTRIDVGQGLAELAIYGLDGTQFSSPRPVDLGLEVNAFNELTVSVAREILQIDRFLGFKDIRVLAGVSPKLLVGVHGASMDFNSDLTISGDSLLTHDFSYTFQTRGSIADSLIAYQQARDNDALGERKIGDFIGEPEGSEFMGTQNIGVGFDVGATIEMDISSFGVGFFDRADEKKLRISVAVTDIGKVIYADNVAKFEADGTIEWRGLDIDDAEVDENFDGSLGDYADHVLVDSLLEGQYAKFESTGVSEIYYELPTRATLAGQLQIGNFALATDIGMGFNEAAMNSQELTIAVGTEYKILGFFPIRAGVRTGGNMATRYSAGTGLDFRNFTFDFGVMSPRYGAKKGAGVMFAWSGLQLRF